MIYKSRVCIYRKRQNVRLPESIDSQRGVHQWVYLVKYKAHLLL